MTTRGLMIAAPSSGSGKTTVTLGLLRALKDAGIRVQPFKNGPDYIDPAFHQKACGRASYNLDSWAMNRRLLNVIAAEADDVEIVIAEGAMGLFDGAAGQGCTGNGASADIARLMGWPILLIMDVSGQSQSAAAIAHGFRSFDPNLKFAGVILNHVASARHEAFVRQAMEAVDIPVLGAIPRNPDVVLPTRHLGLVQATEQAGIDDVINQYACMVRDHVDMDAIIQAACAERSQDEIATDMFVPPAQHIAFADDAAFSFTYPHMMERWRRAGAELTPFSPLKDEAPVSHADMVWLSGGYPELYAGQIASAETFLRGLRSHAQTRPVHGECGGYMVLGEGLVDQHGERHRMAGLLSLETSFANRRLNLGYRVATLHAPIGAYAKATQLYGHEFHYSTISEQRDLPLASIVAADGKATTETGSYRGHVTGTFFHMIAPAE